jgi:hypothetical protein
MIQAELAEARKNIDLEIEQARGDMQGEMGVLNSTIDVCQNKIIMQERKIKAAQIRGKYVCVCVCACVCMNVYIYMYVYIHMYIHLIIYI